jgi:hypothetical protein
VTDIKSAKQKSLSVKIKDFGSSLTPTHECFMYHLEMTGPRVILVSYKHTEIPL